MTGAVDFVVLPVAVHALATPSPIQVVGTDLDFAALPWSDGARDHNSNVPNIGAFAMTRPFEQGHLMLGAGVHLHWTLPAALRRGAVQKTAFCTARGATSNSGPFFPAAPNRWLVRRIEGGVCRAAWIVESDFVTPADPARRAHEGPDALPVSYPQPFRRPGTAPYVHLGRAIALTERYEGSHPDNYLAGPDTRSAPLTCVGYGSPEFAAFHGNCRGVFGHRDPDLPAGEALYEVTGWHEAPGDEPAALDPLWQWHADWERRLREGSAEPAGQSDALAGETGLRARDADRACPRRIVCYGRVIVRASEPEEPPGPVGADVVGLGHSATEALSALVARDLGTTEGDRSRIERKLDALRLGARLRDHGLDLTERFDEARHDARFELVARRRFWAVRPAEAAERGQSDPTAETGAPPDLPASVAAALHRLNDLQARYQQLKAEIESLRMRLYCDWQTWMIARHQRSDRLDGFEIDVNALGAMIRRDAEALRETVERGLGEPNGPEPGSLLYEVSVAKRRVQETLDSLGEGLPPARRLRVVLTPGPRFVKPRDPVVALTGEHALPSRRFPRTDAPPPILSNAPHPETLRDRVALHAFVDRLRDVVGADDPAYNLDQPAARFDALRLEWEVEVAPVAPASALKGLRLPESLVTEQYEMPEAGHDLEPKAPADPVRVATTLRGRTLMDPATPALMRSALEALRERTGESGPASDPELVAAVERAEKLRPQTQALHGLTDALVGLQSEIQLPIEDPLGFDEEEAISASVARALDDYHPPSPVVRTPFLPLRNGAMRLSRLRLVDGFGRVREVMPTRVAAADGLRRAGAAPYAPWVTLAPRFSQPARLGAHWVSALDDAVELNDVPATSPVLGWLCISHLDRGELAWHSADGRLMGRLDRLGRWRPAPGGTGAATPGDIADPHLAGAARWAASRPDGARFVAGFAAALDCALDSITPIDSDGGDLRALLTSRPLALVRLRVTLEFLGLPAEARSTTDLLSRLAGGRPNTRGVEAVRLPLRVGEVGRHVDGVVAYWVEAAPGAMGGSGFVGDICCSRLAPDAFDETLRDAFKSVAHANLPGGDAQPGERRDGAARTPGDDSRLGLGPAGRHGLTIAAADAPLTLLMLVDPRAPVHLSCGALPTRKLILPSVHYREAMGRIGFTHLAGPLVMPAARLELPLPDVPGARWAWLTPGRKGWREVSQTAMVARAAVEANWPDRGGVLWTRLHALGWLQETGDPARAAFVPPTAALGPVIDGIGDVQETLTALERLSERIVPPQAEPRLDAPQVLREGWIRLDASTEPRPPAKTDNDQEAST